MVESMASLEVGGRDEMVRAQWLDEQAKATVRSVP